MRCPSPPESVDAALSSVKYPRPTRDRKPNLASTSFNIWVAIVCSRLLSASSVCSFLSGQIPVRQASTHYNAFSTDRPVTSIIFIPRTVTANTSGFNRAPSQVTHGCWVIYLAMSSRTLSDSVSTCLRSMFGMTPSKAVCHPYTRPF